MTYIENKKHIFKKVTTETFPEAELRGDLPIVTIIVPCFNEEKTLSKTLNSLLALNYPKDKLEIIAVNDGSIDNTSEVLRDYANKHSNIKFYKKENGGKHTALNLGLKKSRGSLVGCLDADSFVDSEALINIVKTFQNENIMAIVPSIRVYKPKTLIQRIQSVEYDCGIFLRKMLSMEDSLYVTPGPFSIFRKKIFNQIGEYKKAHNTEDLEMALRLQKNHMRISNCVDASVYTVAPNTIRRLVKQRVRWTHGFMRNAFDYREMIFKKEYGSLGLFIMPTAILSLITALFLFTTFIINILHRIYDFYIHLTISGFTFRWPTFDLFYLKNDATAMLTLTMIIGTICILLLSRKIAHGKASFTPNMLLFMVTYGILAPIWITKSTFNLILGRGTIWR